MKAEGRKQKAEIFSARAFVQRSISAFCLLLSAFCSAEQPANVKHGKELTAQYGCTSCHEIPGVKGPRGMVGQPMDPQNQMPNLGVTPDDARDIAAFLGTLK